MEALIGVVGFLGFLICFVLFVIHAVKKRPKKKVGIGMAVCFVLFLGAFSATEISDTNLKEPLSSKDLVKPATSSSPNGAKRKAVPSETDPPLEFCSNPESTPAPTQEIPTKLKGRGWSDSGREEPQYEGVSGYVVINYIDSDLSSSEDFCNTPWQVPIYRQDKQFYVECGTVEHKTPVVVKSQSLTHESYGAYSGYLTVVRTDNQEEFCIDVGNFMTEPYWENDDLVEAALDGYFIAEYHGKSDYCPVNSGNEPVILDDGMKVLVVGKTGLYGRNGPDKSITPIEAIVFKEWKYGYGGVEVFFHADDLTITY